MASLALSKGTLWRSRIHPQTGKVTQLQQLLDRDCEFPIVSPQDVGAHYRYIYLSVYRDGVDISQEMFGAIARLDLQTDNLTVADLGENRYPTEPIYVPDARNTKQGWVLTVIYDGGVDRSEVWVYDSERMDDEPVCKL
ncbi:MAG: carotenoid oxygenase family protein [Hormoscilla sp. GM102CHS1]|nr:carotenoid oxygenase family protein [Hormoscilla sp. GM102CHS1]